MSERAAVARTPDEAPAEVRRARDVVLRHGWNATSYQLVNPGLRRWFDPAGDAVVGYNTHDGVAVVAGAPACAPERLEAVVAAFESARAADGQRTCYFAAEQRLEALFRDRPDRAQLLLGAQPCWAPADFADILAGHASLRAQPNRARNKGIAVTEWPSTRATRDPELERCLREWLSGRGLPPLRFLVEPDTLGRLWDRRVFVAARGETPVAFLVASPIAARRGWLIEQMVRGHDAPNGTNELLVTHAMAALADTGAKYATLGLAPLSRRAGLAPAPLPLWLRLTLVWVRAHGRRFYNFDGVDRFKAKLRPQWWEPIYAIDDGHTFSPRSLYAIAAVFGGCSPVSLVGRAVLRAIRQEARWGMSGKWKAGSRT